MVSVLESLSFGNSNMESPLVFPYLKSWDANPPWSQKQGLDCQPQVPSFDCYVYTQRLQCSSFLGMTYFLLREYNLVPKKELH